MSDLIQKILCDENDEKYEGLLASLGIVKTLLDCDKNGLVLENATYGTLQKIFRGDDKCKKDNTWFDIHITKNCIKYFSCFDNRKIYYYSKECDLKCSNWEPNKSGCVDNALKLAKKKYKDAIKCYNKSMYKYQKKKKYNDFKEIVDVLVFYLLYELDKDSYTDAIIVLTALCDVLKQRVYLYKTLFKSYITV